MYKNNLDKEVVNIHGIALTNCFKVLHVNKLILDIINDRKSEIEFNSQKSKFSTFQYFQAFFII